MSIHLACYREKHIDQESLRLSPWCLGAIGHSARAAQQEPECPNQQLNSNPGGSIGLAKLGNWLIGRHPRPDLVPFSNGKKHGEFVGNAHDGY